MSKVVRVGQYVGRNPSSAYRFLGLATNGASDATWRDVSGRANHATLGANLPAATAWGTPAYNVTTEQAAATTVPIFLLAAGVWDWDWAAGDSFLICAKGKVTTPAATSAVLGASGSVAAKNGVRMRSFATQKTDMAFTDSLGNSLTVTATAGNMSAASPSDVSVAWAVDSANRVAHIYLNGAVEVSGFAVPLPPGSYKNVANPFYIGGAPSGSSNFVSTACAWRELHMLIARGRGLPANLESLVGRLHHTYEYALTESEFPG